MQDNFSALETHSETRDWVNQELYPFQTFSYKLPMGSMEYVDEGKGDPIVMIHGNSVWSFIYRKLIFGLRDKHRCIAPDHIGFGQSDKPLNWSYLPEDHAINLEQLLESLDLTNITLIVQDWGGPTGLSYAIAHPERIKRLVILNTWMWNVSDDNHYRMFSGLVGGLFGRQLCRYFNLFTRAVVPQAYGDRSRLTPETYTQLLAPHPESSMRKGTWVFPQQIIASAGWLDKLWKQRGSLIDKPTLIAWGMKDIAFREKELRRWQSIFPQAQVTRFETAGHYVQDEAGEEIAELIKDFITSNP